METYFEAYARRLKNNHQKLMEVSEQLKQNGLEEKINRLYVEL